MAHYKSGRSAASATDGNILNPLRERNLRHGGGVTYLPTPELHEGSNEHWAHNLVLAISI
ncbi:uncharacterized protein CLUP02_14107 [Colletotrichum lupini]|uniref:Uncharacterized protein n=1 Tax=Colletotrichum lupini TaxID=145971 RepID=A0A9Q8WMS1_9PEZI|nr:uncharacterized protein CLUP02_14107 [Colletotrichum lupini]UQC88582.1 hypothetical protein CLUP02_14107 [Colletotrichum lupini]